MAGFSIFEVLFGLWVALFLFVHFVMKHFLLERLKEKHPDVWQRMSSPAVTSISESHWTLIGFTRDSELCAQLGSNEESRITRFHVYRYRLLAVIELLSIVVLSVLFVDR